MTEPAAFRATYSDLRFVKSRKVAQVIVELPIEDAGRFVEAFGAPNPATETWVAIARLQEPEKAQEKPAKKAWKDLPPSQQAAIRSGEISYWRFLEERYGNEITSPDDATLQIRRACGVASRTELDKPGAEQMIWKATEDAYYIWLRGYDG